MLKPPLRSQSGLSIIELMVGIAVGLTVLAGASKLFADYMNNNRQLLLATRLNQEIRSVADVIARDLRRAGYWQNALAGVANGSVTGADNAYGAVSTSTSALSWRYAQDSDNLLAGNESFSLRLQNGVIQISRDNAATWEDLSDPAATTITEFSITPTSRTVSLQEYCFTTGAAYPSLNIRSYDLFITGQASADPTARRTLRESVRVRADEISGSCPP